MIVNFMSLQAINWIGCLCGVSELDKMDNSDGQGLAMINVSGAANDLFLICTKPMHKHMLPAGLPVELKATSSYLQ